MAVDEAGKAGRQTEDALGRLLLHDLRGASCGHGIAVQGRPPACPMCGASSSRTPPRRLRQP